MSETALGEVRGLGPAGVGGHHWGVERSVSLAALALFVWFFVSLWRLPALDLETVTEWLRHPLALTPMLLLIAIAFRHLQMGLIVVVEDYVHEEGSRLGWVTLINFASLFAAALAIVCVLKIALTSSGTPAA
jgi:succinate dehydrogenase / fumarate reductase membrane anchor subunit